MTATPDVRKGPHKFAAVKGPGWALPEVVMPPPPEARALPCPESQQLSERPPLVDDAWRMALLDPVRARWAAKAADPDRAGASRAYAEARARALARPISRKVGECGEKGVTVKCKCPGRGRFRPFGCRQWWLCAKCRADRAPRMGRKLREALHSRFAEASSAWGPTRDERPRFVLLTLTVRHSGCLATDREAIARGWRRFYQRLNAEIGVFPYAGVWEVTPSDGGHVHAHVAVVWPYVRFDDARAWWLKACPESERINFSWKRKDGKPSTPASIANYLGKYLSKGASDAFTPTMAAEISAAMYNKRSVFAARGFWLRFVPECPCCQSPWRVVLLGFPDTEGWREPIDPTPDDDPRFDRLQWELPMWGLDLPDY